MSAAPKPLWIFIHLPKSGGTTLKRHLANHLAPDEEVVEFSAQGGARRLAQGAIPFAARPLEQRQLARALVGHNVFRGIDRLVPGREARYLTFVREPAELCVSLYNFRRSRGQADADFERWYADHYLPRHRHLVVGFYAESLVNRPVHEAPERLLAMATELIEGCWLSGTTDELANGMAILSEEMGIPADWRDYNVTQDKPDGAPDADAIRRHIVLDDALRARIHADCPADASLYEWVRARGLRHGLRAAGPA
ncbi:hypothetical protein ACFQ1E_11470 [Sphingomonas canadensis]|uniref:Sulfotransferase family protein n=1 Tax=Sphingomonas canadensis TaxID=1219257 RepID=A0ABW3HCA8_9SPHN|nr:hypothetical protein [Sphingomonas canadensis]MCW3836904.1 hypothetical protein [Sphingomonas canadensis]